MVTKNYGLLSSLTGQVLKPNRVYSGQCPVRAAHSIAAASPRPATRQILPLRTASSTTNGAATIRRLRSVRPMFTGKASLPEFEFGADILPGVDMLHCKVRWCP